MSKSEEISLEDAAQPDEQVAWRSRQQLRALYFAREQSGLNIITIAEEEPGD